jgi:acyl-CoA synthetase (AMP-forming)/AMP-acid ligase II
VIESNNTADAFLTIFRVYADRWAIGSQIHGFDHPFEWLTFGELGSRAVAVDVALRGGTALDGMRFDPNVDFLGVCLPNIPDFAVCDLGSVVGGFVVAFLFLFLLVHVLWLLFATDNCCQLSFIN